MKTHTQNSFVYSLMILFFLIYLKVKCVYICMHTCMFICVCFKIEIIQGLFFFFFFFAVVNIIQWWTALYRNLYASFWSFFLQTTFLEGISFAFLRLWYICNIYARYFCIQVRELLLLFKLKKIFLNNLGEG